jgi:cell division transport system ATP-binding protein
MPIAGDATLELLNARITQQEHIVLDDVDLFIFPGEFVYLVGKTGSGKSSLLKVLYAELPLDSGEGKVCGFELGKLKRKDVPFLRRKLGIVFQDFELLTDRSVNENLLFVLRATGWTNKAEMNQRIQEVLEKVGIGSKGYKMPHELSGGEQQRVAIARALLNDPDMILADEPTGNLDPETSEGIMRLLTDISRNGKAVLMATHDQMMIDRFPGRILQCENGRLQEIRTAQPNVSFNI